jgi:hypothetical protein
MHIFPLFIVHTIVSRVFLSLEAEFIQAALHAWDHFW